MAAWYFWSARDVYSSSQVIALSNSWGKGADQAWSADVPANLEPYVVGDHFLTFSRTDATLTGQTPLGRDMKKAWQITLNDEDLMSTNASVPGFQTWGDNTIVYKSTLIDVRSGNISSTPWGDGNSALIASEIAIFCNSSDKCTAWDANQKQKWSRDIPGTGEASTFTFLRNELTLTRDGRRYICLYNIVINIDSGETLIPGGGSRADTDLRTTYFKDGWGTHKEDKKDSTPDSESSPATRPEVTTHNIKGNKQDNYIETLSRETRVVLDENELLTAKEYRTYFKDKDYSKASLTSSINESGCVTKLTPKNGKSIGVPHLEGGGGSAGGSDSSRCPSGATTSQDGGIAKLAHWQRGDSNAMQLLVNIKTGEEIAFNGIDWKTGDSLVVAKPDLIIGYDKDNGKVIGFKPES